jgi:predicted Zn-dependent protease
MRHADALIDWLEQRPAVDGAAVVGWRFEVANGIGVRAGIRASRLGGPYEGPGAASRLVGSLELHWSDGLVTRCGLDRRGLADPGLELDAWRADAVAERRGRLPPLADQAVLPVVETFDPAAEAATGDAATGLRMLQQLLERSRSGGVRRVDAVLRTSRTERTVATSRGFRADWQETACSIELWGDEICGASYGRRCLPGARDLDRLAEAVATLAPCLAHTDELPPNARSVLFMPNVVQDLLERLVLPNLSGRAIRDGRSPFSRADLETRRQVIRADLDLMIDTTLPFELASAPCSSEGVPAGRVRLIAEGRLSSPVLGLATAAEWGMPPTPAPRGRPAAVLGSALPAIDADEALALLGEGVVVRDLPGLHTQPARRATYALVVPDAQAVVGGEGRGRCAVRLAGGLLDHLRQPSTRIVRIPGDPNVGLLVLTGVELLPA